MALPTPAECGLGSSFCVPTLRDTSSCGTECIVSVAIAGIDWILILIVTKFLLERYDLLRRVHLGSQNRNRPGSSGEQFTSASLPSGKPLPNRSLSSRPPESPVKVIGSSNDDSNGGVEEDSLLRGQKNRCFTRYAPSSASSAYEDDETASDAMLFLVQKDPIARFYAGTILLFLFTSMIEVVVAMNPMRCDQRCNLLDRGRVFRGVLMILTQVFYGIVSLLLYTLLAMTDIAMHRSQIFKFWRRFIFIAISVVPIVVLLVLFAAGVNSVAFETFTVYFYCVYGIGMGVAAAVLGFYIPWILSDALFPKSLRRIRVSAVFLCSISVVRGLLALPVKALVFEYSSSAVELSVAHFWAVLLIFGAIAILRTNRTQHS